MRGWPRRGCKPKYNDASTGKAFVNLDDDTRSAIENAQKAQGARMCGEVINGKSKIPAAMVISGSMPTPWRAIEDELLKVGWVRTDQTETPKPDDTLFQVHYQKKAKGSSGKTPMHHLKFFRHGVQQARLRLLRCSVDCSRTRDTDCTTFPTALGTMPWVAAAIENFLLD